MHELIAASTALIRSLISTRAFESRSSAGQVTRDRAPGDCGPSATGEVDSRFLRRLGPNARPARRRLPRVAARRATRASAGAGAVVELGQDRMSMGHGALRMTEKITSLPRWPAAATSRCRAAGWRAPLASASTGASKGRRWSTASAARPREASHSRRPRSCTPV